MSDTNEKVANPALPYQQAEFLGLPLTIEQQANKIAYQSGIPVQFVYRMLQLEARVVALEGKLGQ